MAAKIEFTVNGYKVIATTYNEGKTFCFKYWVESKQQWVACNQRQRGLRAAFTPAAKKAWSSN